MTVTVKRYDTADDASWGADELRHGWPGWDVGTDGTAVVVRLSDTHADQADEVRGVLAAYLADCE